MSIPEIGSILKHETGAIAIVEDVNVKLNFLHMHIMHMPKEMQGWSFSPLHIPVELIGVTWQIIA